MSNFRGIVVTALVAVALTGCQSAPPPVAEAPAPAPVVVEHVVEPVVEPATFAAVGDSITSWSDKDTGEPLHTWVASAQSERLELIGGWAKGGMNTREMLAGVTAEPLPASDVLVIMAGTNDVGPLAGLGITRAESMSNLDRIVEAIGPQRVIVSAIAPQNFIPWEAIEYNTVLAGHASQRGWVFVDPWTTVRAPDGSWVAGANKDELHPTPATHDQVGAVMGEFILSVAG